MHPFLPLVRVSFFTSIFCDFECENGRFSSQTRRQSKLPRRTLNAYPKKRVTLFQATMMASLAPPLGLGFAVRSGFPASETGVFRRRRLRAPPVPGYRFPDRNCAVVIISFILFKMCCLT